MSRSEPTSTNRKRKGVVRASVTRLLARVSELEHKERPSPGDLDTARRLQQKLEELDSDFKTYHLAVVDLTDDEALDTEQAMLDEHDDKVTDLSARLQQLVSILAQNPL
jgi:ATP-dependent helicase/DNAse subunit B